MTHNHDLYIEEKIEEFYGFKPCRGALLRYKKWEENFLKYNLHTNLMSKNDISVLFEKHVLDSLAITLLEEFKDGIKLLDIGAGGGFPSLILAIFFPEIEIIALDSVLKKIKFLESAKEVLELSNFEVCHQRAETKPSMQADIITNRAVGKIIDVWNVSNHHLKKGGIFVSYKALSAKEEAKIFKDNLQTRVSSAKFIPYKLPLKENFTRELVVFKKN